MTEPLSNELKAIGAIDRGNWTMSYVSLKLTEIEAQAVATALACEIPTRPTNPASERDAIADEISAALNSEADHEGPSYPLGSAPVVLDDGSDSYLEEDQ